MVGSCEETCKRKGHYSSVSCESAAFQKIVSNMTLFDKVHKECRTSDSDPAEECNFERFTHEYPNSLAVGNEVQCYRDFLAPSQAVRELRYFFRRRPLGALSETHPRPRESLLMLLRYAEEWSHSCHL